MASRPPEGDDIVISGRRLNKDREIIAYVPQIGALTSLGGLHYDMAISEEVTHQNEFTRHPIEDPQRSFIYDHNREEPASIQLSLLVSANPLVAGANSYRLTGVDRLTRFQDRILALRAAQSVDTSAYLDVYTGLRIYRNMGIENLVFRRSPDTPNVLEVDITLVEFRFARPPRAEANAYLIDANDGPRNTANAELVTEADRPIVESTRIRATPRMATPSSQQLAAIRASLNLLGSRGRLALGIDISVAAATTDEIGLVLLDAAPSQQYTLSLAGRDTDIQFGYNQIADRWSFSAAVTGGVCPAIGGRFVQPGVDLLVNLGHDEILVPLDRPGITTSGTGWYDRLTRPLEDGAPVTMLAMGSTRAFASLFVSRTAAPC